MESSQASDLQFRAHPSENKKADKEDKEDKQGEFIPESIACRLMKLAYYGAGEQFRRLLQREVAHGLEVETICDKRDFTLLHVFTQTKQLDMLHLVVQTFWGQPSVLAGANGKYILTNWFNRRNNNGFTPIHFAAFNGSLAMLDYLVSQGADLHMTNYQGQNVLHCAAQGDHPLAMLYFMHRGVQANTYDSRGSTALQWAAYQGSLHCVTILLQQPNLDLDNLDKTQHSALHLAVARGYYKIAKRLLTAGADHQLKDKEARTVLDMAKQFQNTGLVNLIKAFRSQGLLCGAASARLPRRTYLCLLVALLLLDYTLLYLFIVPFVDDLFSVVLLGLQSLFTVLQFLYVWLRQPGFISKPCFSAECLIGLLEQHGPDQLCLSCCIVKPARSKHCEICSRCVSVYDHHCPWINNCVGSRNQASFALFLFSLLAAILSQIFFVAFHFSDFTLDRFFPHLPRNTAYLFYQIKMGVSCALLLASMFFLFPLCYLSAVQIQNLFSD